MSRASRPGSATPASVAERRAQAGDSWLAERLSTLSAPDRLAIERAVAVLESFVTERLEGVQADSREQPGAKEARA